MEETKIDARSENIPTAIRQNLVNTATDFLNMKNIIHQPESMKRQFLEKKGLTVSEIDAAFSKSSIPISSSEISPNNLTIVPPPHFSNIQSREPSTFWSNVKTCINSVIFLTGVTYGISYVYKYYIGPYLTGKRYISPVEATLEIQKSVMELLQQIDVTLQRINRNIIDNSAKTPERDSIEDLKAEIKTIKGLLINKNSIPPPPSLPSLPPWQLMDKSEPQDAPENGSQQALQNGESTLNEYKMAADESLQNGGPQFNKFKMATSEDIHEIEES